MRANVCGVGTSQVAAGVRSASVRLAPLDTVNLVVARDPVRAAAVVRQVGDGLQAIADEGRRAVGVRGGVPVVEVGVGVDVGSAAREVAPHDPAGAARTLLAARDRTGAVWLPFRMLPDGRVAFADDLCDAHAAPVLSALAAVVRLPKTVTVSASARQGRWESNGRRMLANPDGPVRAGDPAAVSAHDALARLVTESLGLHEESWDLHVVSSGSRAVTLDHLVSLVTGAALHPGRLVCVDELDLGVGSVLLRRVLRYLDEHTANQYLIAAGCDDVTEAGVGRVLRVDSSRGVDGRVLSSLPSQRRAVREAFGVTPSVLARERGTVWVAGPVQEMYLRAMLSAVAPDLDGGRVTVRHFSTGRARLLGQAGMVSVARFVAALSAAPVVVLDGESVAPWVGDVGTAGAVVRRVLDSDATVVALGVDVVEDAVPVGVLAAANDLVPAGTHDEARRVAVARRVLERDPRWPGWVLDVARRVADAVRAARDD